jgi:DNA primase
VTGKTIGYSARVAPGGDESQAKYVNTPETEAYHKSIALYGIDKAKMDIKKEDWVLLVEGNMDVIAAWQAGIKNTIAISGTAMTPEQLNIIKRYTKNIKMFFDMDEAGQKAAKRSAEIAFEKEMNVSIVEIENGKDAADAVRDDMDNFLKAVDEASSAMEYFIEKLLSEYDKNKIEDKKKIIEELSGLVNSFSSKVEKEHWIRKISEKLDISESTLFDAFNSFQDKFQRVSREEPQIDYNRADEFLQNREDSVELQIMGFLISDDNVWKEAAKKYQKEIEDSFSNKKVVDIIIKKGKESDFNFEKLINKIEDENQKKYLRKIYFENIEKGEQFSTTEDKLKAVEVDFTEIRKRKKKNRIRELFEKMTVLAQEGGSNEEIEKVRKELLDLSEDK